MSGPSAAGDTGPREEIPAGEGATAPNEPPQAGSPSEARPETEPHTEPHTDPGTDSGEVPLLLWAPAAPPAPRRGAGAWALFFAIVGLIAALFVGWGFPICIVAIVTAAFALRRPVESRAVAGWALALGLLGLLYCAGWLAWGAMRGDLFG